MSTTIPSDLNRKPKPSRRLATRMDAPVQPNQPQIDHDALERAKDVATRFGWYVVVGVNGALTQRGRYYFKESQAAQYAVNSWEDAVGCFLPDGRFYKKTANG
jgi:hypothetical protein